MARQYAVYVLGPGDLVVDVQSDLIDTGLGRVVAPLVPVESVANWSKTLNPVLSVGDAMFVMLTQTLGTVPLAALKKQVGDVSDRRDDITRALDILFHGV